MKISVNRLKKYIKNSESIDWLNIWNTFTLRTAEVEGVTEVGNSFDSVVVAEIKECSKHPDSDHMHILMLDDGSKELVQVVCGAPNVKVGLKTAYVKVGGHIDGYEITARPLRGVISNGMCCSFKELGIGEAHDGIIELPEDAPVGMDIKKYLPIEDIIVEIDNKSLTNRPDLWGHYGIAREIAAITEHVLLPIELLDITNDKNDLDIKILDEDVCSRYEGLRIENINNNTTPMDIQIFLNYTGMRSISLLVDLTNYIMLELGQPMHAFDARVVKNIEVGRANNGDKFTTLDGQVRNLTANDVMIKNGNEYFCIAGVMGGLDSEILTDTTSVFIESANFNPGMIRKTAISIGLRTEASARYEKDLDPNLTDIAIKRFAYLLKKSNPDMNITSNLTDVYPKRLEETKIVLFKDKLSKYMGTTLEDATVKNMLDRLGLTTTINKDSYEVIVPTYRHTKDITKDVDLIEEVARMYGLENFTPKPLKLDLIDNELETVYNQELEVKTLLAEKYDMHEINSYLWYDTSLLKTLGVEKTGVKLLGKSENNILRDDLSFSLLNIVERNFKNLNHFEIFEIGTIIENNQNKRVLSIILAGEEKELESLYNKAKVVVKYIFKNIKHKDVLIKNSINEKDYYDNSLGKIITIDDTKVGTINVLNRLLTNKLSKKKCVVMIDINFDKYVSIESNTILEKLISKYPSVELDYTITLNNMKYEDLSNILNNFRSNLILDYGLKSVYENKYTVFFSLGSMTKTLEQKDIDNFKDRFIKFLNDNDLKINE